MKVAITGATGFVGNRLVSVLKEKSIDVLVISRDVEKAHRLFPSAAAIQWNPPDSGPSAGSFVGVDTVVNLAGATVARRWTSRVKQSVRDSRVLSTRLLVESLLQESTKPKVLVSASAIGYYGPRGDTKYDESGPGSNDFLGDVSRQWEAEAMRAASGGIRVVTPRIGIVLGSGGGALAQMLFPFKMGVGGPIGDGSQWMSWIHIDDLVNLFLHAIEKSGVSGPLNATAPEPVTNREFSKTLGRVLKRPAFLPTPPFALKLAFGEFADILSTGQRIVPAKALASGFQFRYPSLEGALRNILGR